MRCILNHYRCLQLGLVNGCRRICKKWRPNKLQRAKVCLSESSNTPVAVIPKISLLKFSRFRFPTSAFRLLVFFLRFTTSDSKAVFLFPSARMRQPTTVPCQVYQETSVTTHCEFPNCNMPPPYRGTPKASPLLGAYHFNYDPAMLQYISGMLPLVPTVPLARTAKKAEQDTCKKLACEICRKTFLRPSALKVHMRIHSGDRPFKCPHCPRTFTQSGNLTVHLRKHSGEKPFACTICLKRFAQTNSLRVHIRRHTGEKPYQCGECQKRFADR